MQRLSPSVLRAHNSEDSGIFLPFYSKQRRLLYRLSKATERCFRLCLSSVFRRFRRHLFSRTWCAPLRSRLLAHYIIRLHGIWTRFWSTCQAPLFEPLAEASFRNKTRKALFLLAMATAKHIGNCRLSHSQCLIGETIWFSIMTRFFWQKQNQCQNPFPDQS